tara:strand:+ start:1091 stop:1555 length:465 start_codon:yes stop_codon:yes gene_type:complete
MMDEYEFARLFNSVLKSHKLEDDLVCSKLKISRATFHRWLTGASAPHPLGQDAVFQALDELKRENESLLNSLEIARKRSSKALRSSNITVEVGMLAGTEVKDAIKEAKEKAIEWGVAYVTFNFNGIRFSISRKANLEEALTEWRLTKNTGSVIL